MENTGKRKYSLESKVSTFDREKALKNANGNEQIVEFAFRLCTCLDNQDMNESELARITGIGKASINGYIKAEQIPSINKIILLAKHLNVSTDYLLGLINTPSIEENYKVINKSTGLSKEAINILKDHLRNHKEAVKNNKQQSIFSGIINTINFLIENEPKYHFFTNLSSYLWFDTVHSEEIKNKKKIYDDLLEFSYYYDILSDLMKVELDRTLYKIKEEIEKDNN